MGLVHGHARCLQKHGDGLATAMTGLQRRIRRHEITAL